MTKGPLAVRWGDWTLEEPHAGTVGVAARRARERRHGRLARPGPALLPLARPARQPDRLGRGAHAAAARRSGRAGHGRGARARPDPARAATASPSTSSPSTGSGSRSSGASRVSARGRGLAATRRPARRSSRLGRAGARLAGARRGRPRRGLRRRRRLRSSWLGGLGRPTPEGARALRRRAPAASPGSRSRCSARRCWPGSRSSRLPDVAGLPAFAAPTDEPWIYDGRVVLRAKPAERTSLRARPRAGRRSG